jgi:hypothetical protein
MSKSTRMIRRIAPIGMVGLSYDFPPLTGASTFGG